MITVCNPPSPSHVPIRFSPETLAKSLHCFQCFNISQIPFFQKTTDLQINNPFTRFSLGSVSGSRKKMKIKSATANVSANNAERR